MIDTYEKIDIKIYHTNVLITFLDHREAFTVCQEVYFLIVPYE